MGERFVVRDEPFGYTLFDRVRLQHKFLKREELNENTAFNGVQVKSFEKWDGKLNVYLTEIIYSPVRIYYELTQKCNLQCKMCFNSSGQKLKNELTLEEVKKTLKGLRNDNVFDVRFSGGEPTQHSHWFEIMQYAKDIGFAVSMNTNGVYSDKSIIEQIASLNLDQVTINIDGGKNLHDMLRGKGSFEKAVSALKELHSKGAHMRINTIITKGTINDLEEILDLAGKYTEEINFFTCG